MATGKVQLQLITLAWKAFLRGCVQESGARSTRKARLRPSWWEAALAWRSCSRGKPGLGGNPKIQFQPAEKEKLALASLPEVRTADQQKESGEAAGAENLDRHTCSAILSQGSQGWNETRYPKEAAKLRPMAIIQRRMKAMFKLVTFFGGTLGETLQSFRSMVVEFARSARQDCDKD